MATAYAAVSCAPLLGVTFLHRLAPFAGAAAAAAGVLGVFCSTMIYADTRRPFWAAMRTGPKFFGTALLLGLPVALCTKLLAARFANSGGAHTVLTHQVHLLCSCIIGVAMTKLLLEAAILLSLRHRQLTPIKRTALLMTGDLRRYTVLRFLFGVLGGVVLPASLLYAGSALLVEATFVSVFVPLLIIALVLAGEFLERFLFFAAVTVPRMPGTLAS